MKRALLMLMTFIFAVSAIQAKNKVNDAAKDKDEPEVEFFVRVTAKPQDVIIGDSTVISYVLYATAPFSDAELKDKVKVKNASVRQLPLGRQSGSARVVEDGKVYYTIIGARFMVTPDELGTITLPSCDFEATFRFRKSSGNPFEQFFGYSGPTYEVKRQAKNETQKVTVKEKPKRKTSEMLNDGLM